MEYGGRLGCHQRPDRSFFFKGYQFPVCARCTGVLLGEIIAIFQIASGIRIDWKLIIASLVPMGMDWGIQHLKIQESNNIRRLITGTMGGIGLTFAYFYILKAILYDLSGKVIKR